MAAGEQRWRDLAGRIAGESGFDLEDFAVVNAGRRRLVKVVIDSDDGVALDDAADVSRRLSEAFDSDDDSAAGGSGAVGALPYTLEVTSPGIGRPLTEPRHFHRARTRLISITTTDGRTIAGRVVGISATGVDLLTGKSGTDPLAVPFTDIVKAKAEVDFSGPSAAVRSVLAADPRSAGLLAADARGGADADAAVDSDVDGDAEGDNDADSDADSDADVMELEAPEVTEGIEDEER